MDSIVIPYPRELKVIRERVIGKVKAVIEKADKESPGSPKYSLELGMSCFEFFIMWDSVMYDKDISSPDYPLWEDVREDLQETEAKCDEILSHK